MQPRASRFAVVITHEESNKYLDHGWHSTNTKLNDAEVSEAVRKIIAEKVHENDNDDVKRFLFGSIELTSLKHW